MGSYLGNYTDSLEKVTRNFLVTTYLVKDGIRSNTSESFDKEYLPSVYFNDLSPYIPRTRCKNNSIVKPRQISIELSNNLLFYATMIHPEGSKELKQVLDDLDLANSKVYVYGETLSSVYIDFWINR